MKLNNKPRSDIRIVCACVLQTAIGILLLATSNGGCGQKSDPAPTEKTPDAEPPSPPQTTAVVTRPTPPGRLTAIDGILPVEVELNRFESLPIKTKKTIYHHVRAVEAGDAIYRARQHPQSERTGRLLNAVMSIRKEIPGLISSKISDYALRYWIHRGNRDGWTGQKFRPRFIPGELAAAAQVAMNKGADIGTLDLKEADLGANKLQELEALLNVVRPYLFNPTDVPVPATDAGDDQSEGTDPAEPTPARFDEVLAKMVIHLKNARAAAVEAERGSISLLIDYLTDPVPDRLSAYHQQLSALDPLVKTDLQLNLPRDERSKFVSATDPATYSGLVSLVDKELSQPMMALRGQIAEIQSQLGWSKRYNKSLDELTPPHLLAVNAVVQSGFESPVSAVDIDLPTPGIVRSVGRKLKLFVVNRLAAYRKHIEVPRINAFSSDADVTARRLKWGQRAHLAFWVLRELFGGQFGRDFNREHLLPESYGAVLATLKELRADLIALYIAMDPAVLKSGLVSNEECAKTVLDQYVARALEQLQWTRPLSPSAARRVRARRIAVRTLIENEAIAEQAKNGQVALRIADYAAFREQAGELMREVERIIYTGDMEAGNRWVNRLAEAPKAWSKSVQTRFKTLGLPRAIRFLYPLVKPSVNAQDQITDVSIVRPVDFVEYQLSRNSKTPKQF